MQKLELCAICKKNVSTYNCIACGAQICSNCYYNGLCKNCRVGKRLK